MKLMKDGVYINIYLLMAFVIFFVFMVSFYLHCIIYGRKCILFKKNKKQEK